MNSTMEHNMELLKMENDRLEKKLYFREKEIKDIRKELDDAQSVIDELTAKNAELQRLLSEQQSSLPQTRAKRLTATEFRSLLSVSSTDEHERQGMEAEWEDVMVAFSDPIFWEQNDPDVILFRDDAQKCFRTLDGNTVLKYPIERKMLDELGWKHVRPVTRKESDEIIRRYRL